MNMNPSIWDDTLTGQMYTLIVGNSWVVRPLVTPVNEYLKTAMTRHTQLCRKYFIPRPSSWGAFICHETTKPLHDVCGATVFFGGEAFVFVSDSNSAIQIAEMLNQVGWEA